MRVRGAVLYARKSFVIKQFGEQAWAKVLEALSEEDRTQLSGMIIQAGWYPFDLGEELDKLIVDILGKGDTRVFEDIGAQSAVDNLGGIHQSFLTPGDPQAFMKQANSIYQFYYDTGSRTYEQTGPTSGVMTTRDAETFSDMDCLTVIGWYRTALEMCGAKNVRIREMQCRARKDPVCEYQFEWEM